MNPPVHVAVTGAAGQISYSLLFRIASGEMLGQEQPVVLRLLEISQAMNALKGVAMELADCAYPLLQDIVLTDDVNTAFRDVSYAMLVGARPRSKGMERSDLLHANGQIFAPQGRALNEHAQRDVRVLVIGNPANTNALIAMHNAPDLNSDQFTAMTRLDHNRAVRQLAAKTATPVSDIRRMIIWGNHSSTQYPDLNHATIKDQPAMQQVSIAWVREQFIESVQKRGSAIIEARGLSSAASAGFAGLEHMRDWGTETAPGNWTSMAIPSDGSYGIAEGIIYSFPVTIQKGKYRIVQGLEIDDFSRHKMTVSEAELKQERDAIKNLL